MRKVKDLARAALDQDKFGIRPRDLDGISARMAAETTAMRKLKGERDTEFVKRIAAAYLDADRRRCVLGAARP